MYLLRSKYISHHCAPQGAVASLYNFSLLVLASGVGQHRQLYFFQELGWHVIRFCTLPPGVLREH